MSRTSAASAIVMPTKYRKLGPTQPWSGGGWRVCPGPHAPPRVGLRLRAWPFLPPQHPLVSWPPPGGALFLRRAWSTEYAPHSFGGRGEEMGAVRKFRISISDQPKPGLMHERRGLQSVSRRFIRPFSRMQLAQLTIDQRQQLIGGLGSPLSMDSRIRVTSLLMRVCIVARRRWKCKNRSGTYCAS